MAQTGEILDGKYVLRQIIGRGGMSEVWLAEDLRLGKNWAVKEIRRTGNPERDAAMRKHARAEALLMRDLDHPAIPRIVDILESGERLLIVMDLVPGVTLENIERSEGPQLPEKVLEWGIQAAEVLSYLHGRKPPVFYQDMKPANLILADSGRIRLVDFGAAETAGAGRSRTGTPGYASPEQMCGKPADARSDIYSLGITLRQMLTGDRPYGPGNSVCRSRKKKRSRESLLQRDVMAVLERCVREEPGERWQTAAALEDALRHCRKKEERRRRGRKLASGPGIGFLSLGVLTGGLISWQTVRFHRQREYEKSLTLAQSSSGQERIGICGDLIRKYPLRTEAWEILLDGFLEDGVFTETESRAFLSACYDAGELRNPDRPDVRALNYRIGCAYLTMYQGEDDSFRRRMQMACPFFRRVSDLPSGNEPDIRLAGAFSTLGEFLSKYVAGNAELIEPDEAEIRVWMEACRDCLLGAETQLKEDGYLKLTMAWEILGLIREFCYGIRNAGIPESDVEGLLTGIESLTKNYAAAGEKNRNLQREILEKLPVVRREVDLAFRLQEEDGRE